MEFEETFFDDLVSDMLKARVPIPRGEFLKGWNAAVKVCINRIYSFFGRGHPPKSVDAPFDEAYQLAAHEDGEQSRCELKPLVDDPINSPSWYCWGGIETLDFILAKELDFLLGNAVKYISRAGRKDPERIVEDLKKARFYIDKKIEQLERP